MSDKMMAIVDRHYYQVKGPSGIDGAQAWDGRWWAPLWGCDTLAAMLDDMRPAFDSDTETLLKEIEKLRVIAAAAVRSVSNPAWAGVCDEDVQLERVLRDAGMLPGSDDA